MAKTRIRPRLIYCDNCASQPPKATPPHALSIDGSNDGLRYSLWYLYFSYSNLRYDKAMKSPAQTETKHPSDLAKRQPPLSHKDAEAASPEDSSVCGEEDPGSALESLMDDDK